MQKNRLLIVLACLNFAHTTHAVERLDQIEEQERALENITRSVLHDSEEKDMTSKEREKVKQALEQLKKTNLSLSDAKNALSDFPKQACSSLLHHTRNSALHNIKTIYEAAKLRNVEPEFEESDDTEDFSDNLSNLSTLGLNNQKVKIDQQEREQQTAHTTHAVEKSEGVNMQEYGQDGLNELRMQYLLQDLRIKLEGPGWPVIEKKDALIKQAEILHDMIQKTAQPYREDPQVQLMVDILRKLPGELGAQEPSAFEDYPRVDIIRIAINSLADGKDILIPFWDHFKPVQLNDGIYSKYPALNPHIVNDDTRRYIHLVQPVILSADQAHECIEELKKIDPNMAKQALDWFTQSWRRGFNCSILNIGNWKPDIVPGSHGRRDHAQHIRSAFRRVIQSQEGTETHKANREALQGEIIDNLLGDDQAIDIKTAKLLRRNWFLDQQQRKCISHGKPWNNLKQATYTLLAEDPELRQAIEGKIGRITLAKTMKHKGKIKGSLRKVNNPMLPEIIKYL